MGTRISHWLELNFWQLTVRLLSGVRPLSRGLQQTGQSLAAVQPVGWLPRGWALGLIAWALGFAAGMLLAWWP
ncbi:MAG: hypothetical protein KIS85_06755 [Anaerolineales bacterium]|nr:hypothetical protein [Anaerolineales bacterium]